MTPDQHPLKRAGLSENLTGQELFIYDADGQELTVLNRSALMIWSLCDGTHAPADMLAVLAAVFPDVSAEQLQEDVQRCTDSFSTNGLLAT